ncbi:MAG: hypothetical protein LUO79_02935 [Methanomassiliicoccales archaeon]|nr:hypothetical protein [Methanomassiliicoccales archaeon]
MGRKAANPAAVGKEARIVQAMKLMLSGKWISGKSALQLATIWNVSTHTANRDVAEASRRIKNAALPPEEIKARLGALLEGIISQCTRKDKRGNVDLRALRTAVEAIRVTADVMGAKAVPQLELQVDLARAKEELLDDVEKALRNELTDEQAGAVFKGILRRLVERDR